MSHTRHPRRAATPIIAVALFASAANAQVYEWEYINPAQPELGRQPSAVLCPDGAGAVAEPAALLAFLDLTKAYLRDAQITDAFIHHTVLANADLTGANADDTNFTYTDFTNATLLGANLAGANLDNAVLTGALINDANIEITTPQLLSTASHQNADLSGTSLLGEQSFAGVSFAGFNLLGTRFVDCNLDGADFTNADILGGYFSNNLSVAQLQSTATFPTGNLSATSLRAMNYPGIDLSGFNLTDASLASSTLTGADLSNTNLTDASLLHARLQDADLTGADLTGATLRRALLHDAIADGAAFDDTTLFEADLRGSNITQTQIDTAASPPAILPDGRVPQGIDDAGIISGFTDVYVFDHNAPAPIGILMQQSFQLGHHSASQQTRLYFYFKDSNWGSTISFDNDISSVTLDGRLNLYIDDTPTIAPGDTFQLFNWTGVTVQGAFDEIATRDGYEWDTSSLYTNGTVTLIAAPPLPCAGDIDDDNDTDVFDFNIFAPAFGSSGLTPFTGGDLDGDTDVDVFDFNILAADFGCGT